MLFELKKNDTYITEYLKRLSGQCDFRNVDNDFNIESDILDEIPELISDIHVIKYEHNIKNNKSFKTYITPSISIQNPKIPNFKDSFDNEIEHLFLICDKDCDFITFDFQTKIKLSTDKVNNDAQEHSLTTASIEFTKEVADNAFDIIKERIDNNAFNFLNENYTQDELKIIFDTLSNSRTIELIQTLNIKELKSLSQLSDGDNFTKLINKISIVEQEKKELLELKENLETRLMQLDEELKEKTDTLDNEFSNNNLDIEKMVEQFIKIEKFTDFIVELIDSVIKDLKGDNQNEE